MKSRFILEDGRIEYDGEFDFKLDDYVGKILMTSNCNIPRRVVRDVINDGVRVINLSLIS